MTHARPHACRPSAFDLFARQVPVLDAEPAQAARALLRAAVAISMHELEDADPLGVERRIADLADQVRRRVRSEDPEARLAHLHAVLFDEEGFRGNTEEYYHPHNSYLPTVLQARRGLPITLVLLYKCVAQRVGLRAHGINAPMHFLAGVELPPRRAVISDSQEHPLMLVDVFHGGRVLTPEEFLDHLPHGSRSAPTRPQDLLPVTTPRMWLARMLQNLINVFQATGRDRDAQAMLELAAILKRST